MTPAAHIGPKSQPPLLTTRSTGRLLAIGATKVARPSIFVVSGPRASSLQTRDAVPPGRTEDTEPVHGCWLGAADDRWDCPGSGAIHDVNAEVLPPIDPDLLWRRLSCEYSIRQKGQSRFWTRMRSRTISACVCGQPEAWQAQSGSQSRPVASPVDNLAMFNTGQTRPPSTQYHPLLAHSAAIWVAP